MQRLAGALGDNAAEQRSGAAAIGPALSRLHDDGALENVTVAVGRAIHGDLAVGRIGIGNAQLIPIRAHRHRQHMMQRPALPAGIRREIGIFGKGLHQGLLGRRHLACGERDSVQQADDTLRHRAQIVQRIGLERDNSQRPAARIVRTFEIALQHQPSAADDNDRVHVPDTFFGNRLVQPCSEIVGKSRLGWFRRAKVEHRRRACADRSTHQCASGGRKYMSAAEIRLDHVVTPVFATQKVRTAR